MASTSLPSLMFSSSSVPSKLLSPRKMLSGQGRSQDSGVTRSGYILASRRDSYGHQYDGKLVDESMILLRMRIREIEMKETKVEAPEDWMEWEKRYSANYGSDICEAVGLLQMQLMNTRPCLVLGMLALLMTTTTMSMSLVVFHLVEFAKGVIALGIHV
ncbi:hypothetical protein L6164_001626 [Bauhinia variegata]|uniref:Uncharacterized protein n=1 Tax=Bauhinia variegata TaxID=167791 RepID=A0ACB9QCG2_BAUVA|nr:hypothetical protein L6164_001626 [Bauhinia variegata]